MTGPGPGSQRSGALLALTAAVLWGTQFPVAKTLFRNIDPYTLTALRFGIATLGFTAVLRVVEGSRAVRFDGYLRRATVVGWLGLVLGVLIVYLGLEHTQATSAAVVVASQPFITAIVLRIRVGARLSAATRVAIGVAFVGVVLVITRGMPASLFNGSIGWGILLVFAGQVGWVLYTIDSTSFVGFSPLRYTAMTAIPGVAMIVAIAGGAALIGVTHPTVRGITALPWTLAYTIVGPAFLAVLAWHSGKARLGAQNIVLFQNLVPVTTFAIEIVRGYRVHVLELVGAALTIGALTANSIVQRRVTARGAADAAQDLARASLAAPEPI